MNGQQAAHLEEVRGFDPYPNGEQVDLAPGDSIPWLDLLTACEQFVKYADSGKHPSYARYLNTISGAKMRDAVARARAEADSFFAPSVL